LGSGIGNRDRKKSSYVMKQMQWNILRDIVCIMISANGNFNWKEVWHMDKGKGCDTFAPLGPWLVTTIEITDTNNLKTLVEAE